MHLGMPVGCQKNRYLLPHHGSLYSIYIFIYICMNIYIRIYTYIYILYTYAPGGACRESESQTHSTTLWYGVATVSRID